MDPQRDGTSLGLFKRTDRIREQVRDSAFDDSLAVSVEQARGIVRRSCILKLDDTYSLKLPLNLVDPAEVLGLDQRHHQPNETKNEQRLQKHWFSLTRLTVRDSYGTQ